MNTERNPPVAGRKSLFAFLWILLTCCDTAYGQEASSFEQSGFQQEFVFNYLTVSDGLSQNSVTALLQDSIGFMWIGTYDGLNRYDGREIQVKRHNADNPHSIHDNRILSLYQAQYGKLLIGTDGSGLEEYDIAHDRFSPIQVRDHNHQRKLAIAKSICTDEKGRIWVACDGGIVVVDRRDGDQHRHRSTYITDFNGENVFSVFRDLENNIWVGTSGGLYVIRSEKCDSDSLDAAVSTSKITEGHIVTIIQDEAGRIWYGGYGTLGVVRLTGDRAVKQPVCDQLDSMLFNTNPQLLVSSIVQDPKGTMWISTDGLGLLRCGIRDGKFFIQERISKTNAYNRLADDRLNCLYIDRANNLWIGGFQSGVCLTNLADKNIYGFTPLMGDGNGHYVTTVYSDEKRLWIGTVDDGLRYYQKSSGQLHALPSLPSHTILSFHKKDHTIYIGANNGLYSFSETELPKPRIRKLFPGIAIRSICLDKNNRLWLATWEGIIIHDPATDQSQKITEEDGLSSNTGYVLYSDPQYTEVWLGTIGGGLNKISYGIDNTFKIDVFDTKSQKNRLTNNHVWSIYRQDENLWIGTDAGLNQLKDGSTQAIRHPQLLNRKITAIQGDDHGRIWLGSSLGLFMYHPERDEVKQHNRSDGMMSTTFTEAMFTDADGVLYFGSISGLNAFNPNTILQNPYTPPTAFTGLQIDNHEISQGIKINGRVLLDRNINAVEKITLKYNENNISFTLAALQFASASQSRFRYKLINYDKEWQYSHPGQFSLNYAQLPEGRYQLQVSAANNDGIWNDQIKQLDIVVLAAPWLTWWAKIIYLLAAGGLVYLVFRFFNDRKRIRRQVFIEKYEKEKVMELNELKLDFFTKITHELRTPLSLIISPATDLVGNPDESPTYVSYRAGIIHRNAVRLSHLINQVLDLRKISSQDDHLQVGAYNLFHVLQDVSRSFDLLADSREIQLSIEADQTDVRGWFDKDKLEKISYNILANAFHYTPDRGRLTVRLTYYTQDFQHWAMVEFCDSGQGIAPEEINRIFELYYQGKQKNGIGTGIGLALTKKLVSIHKGQISVASVVGQGTTFTVRIPIDAVSYGTTAPSKPFAEPEEQLQESDESISNNTIIVVDDEEELLEYISKSIGSEFKVLKACDGNSALQLAKKNAPQLILSDLIMPDMDGYALLKKLKGDVATHHIPVMIHSVQSDHDTVQKVMKAGADDFIQKPIDYENLRIKMRNILTTRRRLAERISRQQITEPTRPEINSIDEELLKKIVGYIEKNIASTDLSVEKLSKEMGMSRMNLHRKLDTLIGKTASLLIREIRIKIASQLLASGSYRITEAMYEVGIQNHHYFNKYFKDMHGISPKEYIQQHKRDNLTIL